MELILDVYMHMTTHMDRAAFIAFGSTSKLMREKYGIRNWSARVLPSGRKQGIHEEMRRLGPINYHVRVWYINDEPMYKVATLYVPTNFNAPQFGPYRDGIIYHVDATTKALRYRGEWKNGKQHGLKCDHGCRIYTEYVDGLKDGIETSWYHDLPHIDTYKRGKRCGAQCWIHNEGTVTCWMIDGIYASPIMKYNVIGLLDELMYVKDQSMYGLSYKRVDDNNTLVSRWIASVLIATWTVPQAIEVFHLG